MDDETLGLAATIAALRKELTTALDSGADEQVRFRLGPVELEVLLEIKKERGIGGGIKFWVVSLEGKGQQTQGTKHRVKLTLHPLNSNGTDLEIASQRNLRPG